MKKILRFLCFSIILVTLLISVAGCGEKAHEHAYTKEIATQEFLKSVATCVSPAVYYKSCECGVRGSDIFLFGEYAPHSYTNEVAYKDYLKNEATCLSPAEYYKTCTGCNGIDTETFFYGELGSHNYVDGECLRCGDFEISEGLSYKLKNNDTYEVIGIETCDNTVLAIPNTHNDKPVTSIGVEAFKNCAEISLVVLPDTITGIRENAFLECTSLTRVRYGGTINQWASIKFDNEYANPLINASLFINGEEITEVNIDTATEIKDYALICPVFDNVTIGDSVLKIGESAFAGSGLNSVTIGNNVTSIGDNAFYECLNLRDVTIGNNVTRIGKNAFYNNNCYNITFGEKVESIGEYAFYNCRFINLTLPNSVTSIGKGAFSYSNLKSIVIPNSLTNIEDNAFEYCSYLEEVTLEDGIERIGNNAFDVCEKLEEITIPDSVTSIGDSAFHYCTSLKVVEIGNNVENIGSYAFASCFKLTNINFPASVTSIGEWAFFDCKAITAIVLPQNLTDIAEYAFYECSNLSSVTIPDGIVSIGNGAFSKCWIKDITLPATAVPISHISYNSLESITVTCGDIGENAFYSYEKITTLTIGERVTSIGNYSFANCQSLKEVNFNATAMEDLSSNNTAFSYTGGRTEEITVNIGANVTKIPANLFYSDSYPEDGISRVSTLNFAENSVCESIGDEAFKYCVYLKNITIPDSVTSIGNQSFYDCEIQSATIDTFAIPHIPKDKLREVTITSGESIGNNAFSDSDFLISVVILDGVTSIGERAFYDCFNLNSITISNSVISIGNEAFKNCPAMESIMISDGVETIGDEAFFNCTGLTNIIIGNNVKSIGASAFNSSLADSTPLNKVYYKGTETDWLEISIANANYLLTEAPIYYYSEIQPTILGNYWYYDEDGNVVEW